VRGRSRALNTVAWRRSPAWLIGAGLSRVTSHERCTGESFLAHTPLCEALALGGQILLIFGDPGTSDD
jgi:hypothetical protein